MDFVSSQTVLALVEGLGLALSPCILPILPFILAASTGTAQKIRSFLIIAGFIISFTIFALISRQILAALNIQQDTVQFGAYVLLLIFGLIMVVPYLEERFALLTGKIATQAQNASSGNRAEGPLGALLVGGLIGLVWTPCAGPILATAIVQVIQAQTSFEAAATIFAFSIGAAIPMLAIALFSQYLVNHLRFIARHSTGIRRGMGIIIIAFATLGILGFNVAQYVNRDDAPAVQTASAELIDGLTQPYKAPEINGITHWLNSEPLTLQALRGKVVLVDFWTYSCINCIRTLPHIKAWYEKYKDQGLVVIGVHAPEFAFEGDIDNVKNAVKKFGVSYPVAMDNDFSTWRSFKNQYWPAHYLINKNGEVVYTHFGEGRYDVTENNIRYLLGLDNVSMAQTAPPTSRLQTPETYLGASRAERMSEANPLPIHHWQLNGQWQREAEYSESKSAGDTLTLHFGGKKVFLVMESADSQARTAQITVDGKPVTTIDTKDGIVTVDKARLYELYNGSAFTDGLLTITAQQPGLRVYAFTFES